MNRLSNMPSEGFELQSSIFFFTLDAVVQADKFIFALEKRQAHRRVALSSAKKKNEIREQVYSILRAHNIKVSDANKETLSRLKNWYQQKYNRSFPYKDKKLEEYMVDYCNTK